MKQSKLAKRFMPAAFALAAMVALNPLGAQASDLAERGAKDGLKVAFFNYVPFAYKDKSGNLTGTDVDTLKYVLDKMGVKIASADATEWGNLIPGLKSKRFDVVAAGMFVTEKRCRAVKFSETTLGIKQALVVKKDNPDGINTYEDIASKGKKVAVLTGSAQLDWARKAGINEANIMQIPDSPTGVAAIRAGRAVAYAVDAPGARDIVAKLPEKDMQSAKPFGTVAGQQAQPHVAFAYRKDDAAFVEKFNAILRDFIGSEEHIALLAKHGMQADEVPTLKTADICGG